MHTLDRGAQPRARILALATGQPTTTPTGAQLTSAFCAGSVGPAARRRPELKAFVVHPFAFGLSLWSLARWTGPRACWNKMSRWAVDC